MSLFYSTINEFNLKYKYINLIVVYMRFGGVSNSSFKNRLLLNNEILTDDEKSEVMKTIKYLQEQEDQKFINAIKYIECQSQSKLSQD